MYDFLLFLLKSLVPIVELDGLVSVLVDVDDFNLALFDFVSDSRLHIDDFTL